MKMKIFCLLERKKITNNRKRLLWSKKNRNFKMK